MDTVSASMHVVLAAIAAIRRSASWADYADATAALDVAEAAARLVDAEEAAVRAWDQPPPEVPTVHWKQNIHETAAAVGITRRELRAALARLAEVAG